MIRHPSATDYCAFSKVMVGPTGTPYQSFIAVNKVDGGLALRMYRMINGQTKLDGVHNPVTLELKHDEARKLAMKILESLDGDRTVSVQVRDLLALIH